MVLYKNSIYDSFYLIKLYSIPDLVQRKDISQERGLLNRRELVINRLSSYTRSYALESTIKPILVDPNLTRLCRNTTTFPFFILCLELLYGLIYQLVNICAQFGHVWLGYTQKTTAVMDLTRKTRYGDKRVTVAAPRAGTHPLGHS
jgi:hypothetical protein